MAGRGAQGSKILHSDGGTVSTYAAVENVTNISGPSGTAAPIDTTDLESTALENVPDLPDYGQVQLELNWRAQTEQEALYNMFANSSEAEYFKIALPTDSTRTVYDVLAFQATVTGC